MARLFLIPIFQSSIQLTSMSRNQHKPNKCRLFLKGLILTQTQSNTVITYQTSIMSESSMLQTLQSSIMTELEKDNTQISISQAQLIVGQFMRLRERLPSCADEKFEQMVLADLQCVLSMERTCGRTRPINPTMSGPQWLFISLQQVWELHQSADRVVQEKFSPQHFLVFIITRAMGVLSFLTPAELKKWVRAFVHQAFWFRDQTNPAISSPEPSKSLSFGNISQVIPSPQKDSDDVAVEDPSDHSSEEKARPHPEIRLVQGDLITENVEALNLNNGNPSSLNNGNPSSVTGSVNPPSFTASNQSSMGALADILNPRDITRSSTNFE